MDTTVKKGNVLLRRLLSSGIYYCGGLIIMILQVRWKVHVAPNISVGRRFLRDVAQKVVVIHRLCM